jgi:hypothetical protein
VFIRSISESHSIFLFTPLLPPLLPQLYTPLSNISSVISFVAHRFRVQDAETLTFCCIWASFYPKSLHNNDDLSHFSVEYHPIPLESHQLPLYLLHNPYYSILYCIYRTPYSSSYPRHNCKKKYPKITPFHFPTHYSLFIRPEITPLM